MFPAKISELHHHPLGLIDLRRAVSLYVCRFTRGLASGLVGEARVEMECIAGYPR